jgi:glucose/arabinose dehydrogenase
MTDLIRTARGLLASLLLATALPLPASSQVVTVDQQNPRLRVEQILSGLGVPWGMAFLGPTRLLITERSGSLRLLDLETFSLRRVAGVPAVVAEGQGGLLDVAIGPAGGGEGWIYFTYSKAADSEATTALARARLDGERLVDWQDLPAASSVSTSTAASRPTTLSSETRSVAMKSGASVIAIRRACCSTARRNACGRSNTVRAAATKST